MCNDLIANMQESGFSIEPMGGNCRAMVRSLNGRTIVATAEDGPDLPCEDSFLIAVYDGDWLADADVPELASFTLANVGEAPASGYAPIDEALQRAESVAAE